MKKVYQKPLCEKVVQDNLMVEVEVRVIQILDVTTPGIQTAD